MRKGFTLIELIFVIVILAIIGSAIVPSLESKRQDTIQSEKTVQNPNSAQSKEQW